MKSAADRRSGRGPAIPLWGRPPTALLLWAVGCGDKESAPDQMTSGTHDSATSSIDTGTSAIDTADSGCLLTDSGGGYGFPVLYVNYLTSSGSVEGSFHEGALTPL